MDSFYTVTLNHEEDNYIFKGRQDANNFLWRCYMSNFPEETYEQRLEAQHQLNTTSSIHGVGAVYYKEI